ncbi:MAG: ATP-binding protein [Bacteroidota bacterium]
MINSIVVNNFRSVEKYKLVIEEISDRKCFIFLGRNEAGKSNILKAISLLNPIYTIDYDLDCNKKAKKENKDIRIDFEFDLKLLDKLKITYKSLGVPKELFDRILVKEMEYSVVGHTDNSVIRSFFVYFKELELSGYVHDISNDRVILGSSLGLIEDMINEDYLNTHYRDSYKIVTKSSLENIVETTYREKVAEMIPELVYWENSHQYLINEPIDLNLFKEDFTVSITLFNLFKLAGIDDVGNRVEVAIREYEERAQLKDELTNAITTHINNTWPEHEVNIRVEIEGAICSVMVEDKDNTLPKYKMEQRSDGFKQFISILLNLSMKNDKPKILILDEPEVHLHPSGIKYLREELLRISSENIVIISTHSTYMVDKVNINRHYKVYKEKSLTHVKQLDKENPYEEEVIYEALGTSIFEHVQPNMILFEGKTDKDVFDSISVRFKSEMEQGNVGSLSTDGVEKIPQYLKFIDNKFVKGFVIVDSDTDGKKIKRQIIKDFNTARVFELNDLVNVKQNATLEDFFPKDVLELVIETTYGTTIFLDDTPFIKQINEINKTLNGKISLKDVKLSFVNHILNDLNTFSKSKFKEKYNLLYSFVEAVHLAVKSSSEVKKDV